MHTRQPALTAAVLTLALLAAGCGGGGDDPETPAPSASTSAEPTTAPVETYLPVPEAATLTEPGAMLELGEPAVVAWEPRQDLVGVVDLAVSRIDKTTVQKSLASFDLKRDQQRSTPYFVRAGVTNVGDTDLGGRQVPLYLLDSRGVLVAPTGVARDFKACPGSTLPAVFGPGKKARTCLVFLAPEGSKPQSITFRPPEGVVPLQWSGTVSALGDKGETGAGAGVKGEKSGGKRGQEQ